MKGVEAVAGVSGRSRGARSRLWWGCGLAVLAAGLIGAAAQPVHANTGERPALFLGNESLPPISYMKHGKPAGIVVDLADALSKRMHRPVEIRLMDWAEAQQLVLEDRADALLQINPTPDRLGIYDFSDPLLASKFTIFTSTERLGIASINDLRGLKVGTEKKGLPIQLLQKDAEIDVKIIPDVVQGFTMLATGALDAVVVDRWVGSYVIAENALRGVKFVEEPIEKSHSAIAVKKGNANLLADINAALAAIRRDGTYDRIIASWRSKEVVFRTREQLRHLMWVIAVISGGLIAALLSIAALVREIRRRKRIEAMLRESRERLAALAEATFEGIVESEAGRIVDCNEQLTRILGYSASELKGLEIASLIAPEDHDRVMASIQQDRESVNEHAMFRKDGTRIIVETHGRSVSPGSARRHTTIRDITQRKGVEEALRESRAILGAAFASMTEAIFICDAEGLLIDFNEAFVRYHRFKDRLECSRSIADCPRYLDAYFQDGTAAPPENWAMARALRGETASDVEYMLRRKDTGETWWGSYNLAPIKDKDGRIVGAVVACREITDRKLAERLLKEAKNEAERYVAEMETLADAVPAAVFVAHDVDCRHMSGNRTCQELLGLPPTANFSKSATPQERPISFAAMKDGQEIPPNQLPVQMAARGQMVRDYEFDIVFEDGRVCTLLGDAVPLLDESGQPRGAVGAFKDITERKRAEDALRESERRERERAEELAILFESVPIPVFIARDSECLHLTGNRLADGILRIPHGNELSMSGPEKTKPTHFRALKEGRELRLDELPAQRAARGEHVKDFEFTIAFDDGVVRHVLGYGTPLLDDQGNPRGTVASLIDITERKLAEEALRASEQTFATTFHSNAAAMAITHPDDGRVIDANDAWLELTGLSREQIIGKSAREHGAWKSLQDREDMVRELKQQGAVRNREVVIVRPSGEERTVLLSAQTVAPRGEPILLSSATDITTRKQVEEALRASEQRFRQLFTSLNEGFYLSEILYDNAGSPCDYTYLEVNPAFERLMGLSRDQIVGKRYKELIGSDPAYGWLETFRGVALTGVPASYDFYSNAYCRHFETIAFRPAKDQFAVLVTDITERKRAEEALRESERRLIGVLESMPDAFVSFDSQLCYTYVNKNAERLQNARHEELLGKDVRAVYPDPESYKSISQYERVLKEQQSATFVSYHAGFDQWLEVRAFPTPEGVSVFFKDVSDKVHAENALRESEQRLALAASATGIGIFQSNSVTGEIVGTEQFGYLTGLRETTATMTTSLSQHYHRDQWAERVDPQNWLELRAKIAECQAQRHPLDAEYRIVEVDGAERWVNVRGVFHDDDQGNATRFLGVLIDVTERKAAEEALRESEERFRLMGDSIPYGAWMADAEGRNIYISPLFLELVGMTFDQVKEFGWTGKMPPEDVEPMMRRWMECVRTGQDWEGEMRFPSPDGQWHTLLSRGRPVRDAQGQIKAWVGINLDITKRKQAEEQLQQQTRELKKSNAELAAFNTLMVGRELRMIELKKEIDKLCRQFGLPTHYGYETG